MTKQNSASLASAVHAIRYSVAHIEVMARLMHLSGSDMDETDARMVSQIFE